MTSIRRPAGQAGTKAPAKAQKLRKFRVLYCVELAEWYEIEAETPDDAEDRAYGDGKHIDKRGNRCRRGDTLDVTPCDIEEVLS